jgi:hypothetical protein
MPIMKLENLSPEIKQKVLSCQTPEELLALAKEEGYELSEEELRAVSGGGDWIGGCTEHGKNECPNFYNQIPLVG